VLYAVAGRRMLGPLAAVRTWLETHYEALVAVIIAAIGLLLIARGAAGL
jgi:hypothetical protein